ncbi:alanyl-tRNA synthetase family protein [Cryptosporidium serpentis]
MCDSKPSKLKWTGENVRQQFIDFFVNKANHKFYRSSPVVPLNDPTLLFINAGMNQFKSIFTETVEPNSELSKLVRVVNSQKCIRAGGKHNDLDDVGKDVYHHTFFEMLGSWSFGDYFKEEAIKWAFELLTKVYEIPSERLYVTYFGGDDKLPTCPVDEEARDIWMNYLPKERIISCGAKENFWEMADIGPCGPCSEIHFDRIGGRDASYLVNKDDPSVIEIWNLVFMQYYRKTDGSLALLPAKCVDTGMGLERLVSVLQSTLSNYDTDLFIPIFNQIHSIFPNIPQYKGMVGDKDDPNKIDMSYRVIADHIRTLSVAISDGCIPSNEGRGYVLRRILRRAIRYGRQYFSAGIDGNMWFYKLVDSVSNILGDYYPEIIERKDTIKSAIFEEEKQFSKTLGKGIERFNKVANKLLKSSSLTNSKLKSTRLIFPANEAFQLYSTYGFPMDLTELIASELGVEFDHEGFKKCMENHQLASEGKFNKKVDKLVLKPDIQQHILLKYGLNLTDDIYKYNVDNECFGKLFAIYNGHELIDTATCSHGIVGLVFDKTCYYSESGGQVSDIGYIESWGNNLNNFQVIDCQKFGNYVLHIGIVLEGKFSVGDSNCHFLIDKDRRVMTMRNHTATHLLNYALRLLMGDTCDQRGSIVEPTKLRFDFSANKALNINEIQQIEDIINKIIKDKQEVFCDVVPLNITKEISGLRAIFGEAYPDPVRVLSVGIPVNELNKCNFGASKSLHTETSVELCGGTHVLNTYDIGSFIILSEEGIAKGIRRIVAVTSDTANVAENNTLVLTSKFEQLKNIFGKELEKEITKCRTLLDETRILPLIKRKDLSQFLDNQYQRVLDEAKLKQKERQSVAQKVTQDISSQLSKDLNIENILVRNIQEIDGDIKCLEIISQYIIKEFPKVSFMLLTSGSCNKNGISALAIVPQGKEKLLKASQWLRSTLEICGGKCGGNDNKSIGSSKSSIDNIDDIVKFAKNIAMNTE